MRYIDEFRNRNLINRVAQKIRSLGVRKDTVLMEVCGTHTQNFLRFGLHEMLPEAVRLISGPGCPVCVSPQAYIDEAIRLAAKKDTVILTFGDMLRVPGTSFSLEQKRAVTGSVHIVYSPLECLQVARDYPEKKVIFLAVGFETTAPAVAITMLKAKEDKIKNLFFLCSLKRIVPAIEHLLQDKKLRLDGFLLPGHVSAIIGTQAYACIPSRYRRCCCVAGFEPLDILEGIYLLLRQIKDGRALLDNQYSRAVTKTGNRRAQKIMTRVFKDYDACWRGLGVIAKSGLAIRKEFADFDAGKMTQGAKTQRHRDARQKPQCRCGDVLKGIISPPDCPLFSRQCRPENPLGPCMVSIEGACNAYFKYKK